jgi:hypothetical protein
MSAVESPNAAERPGQVAGGAGVRLAKNFGIYLIPIRLVPLRHGPASS